MNVPERVKGDGDYFTPISFYVLYYGMWIVDNIIRGLGMMMGFTLLGYSLIHIYLSIRRYFDK